MSLGRPLFAKLFLEGIEIPFTGASITSTINQATICYIDLVPHSTINNIKPRTLVHLMVRNINDITGKYPFVLAFQGEVFGYNFSKTTTNRTFSISCIDHSSYWDNVLTYFFNPQQSLGQGMDTIVRDAQDRTVASKGANGSVKVTHSTEAYLKKIITKAYQDAKKKGKTQDLFEGLVAIFKDIGDINDFYHLAEERIRISDRIAAASAGAVEKLLKQSESLDWLMSIAGRTSGFSSLRMVVNDLMSLVFHDFASIPFPALIDNDGVTQTLVPATIKNTIGEFIFKPNMYMIAPPCCNVFFPDEYSSFSFSRNFFQEPTRLVYKPEMPSFPAVGIQGMVLPQVYEPPAFDHFMKGPKGAKMPTEYISQTDNDSVSDQPGQFGDKDINKYTGKERQSTNGKKREQAFMTNIEKMKGILLTQENMVPASSQFRQFISEANKRAFSLNVAKYMFNKKKFENRQIQITSHLKISVVPGFTALILDDSDADQNVIAYCSSVTHRIYCNQGGYTNTTLTYARTAGEQDQASGKLGEPLIPPWMSAEIFGVKAKPPPVKKSKAKTKDQKKAETDEQVIVPPALSKYFAKLLGNKGSYSVVDYTKCTTLYGAVRQLISDYRDAKASGGNAVPALIDKVTSRRYITMDEAFKYLGATTYGDQTNTENFLEYYGARLSGDTGSDDYLQLRQRKQVIFDYRDALRGARGFRG